MPAPTLPVEPIRSEDPKQKKKEEDDKEKPATTDKGKEKEKEDGKDENELSEEDLQLKNELEMLAERLKESDKSLHRPALETLRTLIRTSTSSMTSVPKPLKFLRPLYPDLQKLYETWEPSDDQSLFADILSVLAMTYSDTEPRGTLKYRLLSTTRTDPGLWGHEYIRHLASELGSEFTVRQEKDEDTKQLRELALECCRFLLRHNAEADAVDLLEELECIDEIRALVDKDTYARVCAYMVSCVNLLVPPDDVAFLRTAHGIYLDHQRFPDALALAIRIWDQELIVSDFRAPGNELMRRQLAFLLGRAHVPIEWLQPAEDLMNSDEAPPELPEDLFECLGNVQLSNHFRAFGKELGVEAPHSLEDVYKSHLEHTRGAVANVDSARANLAGTYVNAFVNAGFGNDKLMVEAEEGSSWVYKNKDHGMASAAASLGVLLLWDTEIGLTHVDKYTYSAEEYIKAGAFFATGLINCGVRTESDAPYALLGEHVENKSVLLKTNAIMGLGMAYIGSYREDLLALLLPIIQDDTASMEVVSLTSLALGFIFVGSCSGDVAGVILQTLMEREDAHLSEKWARFMALGLALLYLGRQDASDATLETLKAISHPISKQAQVLVEVCSWAGTSNVLKIQSLLHHCDDHIDKEKEDDTFQAFAVLGIAIVAMGEDIGAEMALRTFNHLMHYGEPTIRKTVPLALGLISASNPQMSVVDTLSKYSHDNDLGVALNAIFAMGLVGAGTNNARLAQMLRQLAGYYYKEPDCLFMVRIAQGLVHMGKGTIGINPFFCDRGIMSRTAVAGLLATIVAFTDAKGFILDTSHWMLFFIVAAMYPRFMITLDEELKSKPVTVRVGQAVDVVGQAGKPRTISGFQTHQTPVRLGTTERAELASEEFFPFTNVLEGFVVLQKNPGWEKDDQMEL
ncbi:26S proteasome regulatory complex, non-ATPase subcomplex, Rpn1 subunit [Sistotremastrum niveocremeum HHB9708]|uniref:26S proteasome regulatory subunit RPN1 n=1 Tax=Sistotremastrum niveocremeum HHB9708 TaxID=1314777 RepID=A0A164YUK1_9AGAM|nr:26S proteasome regulatory complex, non-ATPase subcomplex, Rpn1 subunit [Sistotremastrum niveocremeum HHB9708]